MSGKEYNKRVPLIQKSLSVVLASLQGEEVRIELKDDSELHATIDSVGHGMDMRLRNVVGQKRGSTEPSSSNSFIVKGENINVQDDNDDNDNDNNYYSDKGNDDEVGDDEREDGFNSFDLDSTLLRGDSIRFVHIPPHINITNHLSQYMRRFESRNFKKIKIVDRKKLPRIEGDNVITMTSSSMESVLEADQVSERADDS